MSVVSTMFEFAYGDEVNFGNEIPTPTCETKKLDFSKNVVGYGFAIRNDKDYTLTGIQNIFVDVFSSQKLSGIIELKTETSNGAAEHTIPLNLERKGWVYHIPKLSSPLKEIVLWFPKQLNPDIQKVDIKFEYLDIV